MPELNDAIIATYLSGANTRRIKGALRPLLNAAPLSKSAVSLCIVVPTMQSELAAWRTRSISVLKPIHLYLDAFALRVRSGGKVVSVPCLRRWRCWSTGASNSSRWRCAGVSRTRPRRASSTTSSRAGLRRPHVQLDGEQADQAEQARRLSEYRRRAQLARSAGRVRSGCRATRKSDWPDGCAISTSTETRPAPSVASLPPLPGSDEVD